MPLAHELRPGGAWPYVRLARVDHWFKNAFMLLGVLLAFFYQPALFRAGSAGALLVAFFVTCIVASSNYVLNEVLDAPLDREHPTKRHRPAASGQIRTWVALLVWGGLGLAGILAGFAVNGPFGSATFFLWVMGCIYNIPPLRTKELAYLDVITESVNNPIRLLLGWFALVPDRMPPLSLGLAYWMAGAFLMATKRFAEYRSIADPEVAARYRRSFHAYDESKLLASMMFYVAAAMVFTGVFIVRYKLELVLIVPFLAGFFAYYLRLGMRADSPVQTPEKLYRQPGFVAYAVLTTALFVAAMFVEIPGLYALFNVEASSFAPLWRIGG